MNNRNNDEHLWQNRCLRRINIPSGDITTLQAYISEEDWEKAYPILNTIFRYGSVQDDIVEFPMSLLAFSSKSIDNTFTQHVNPTHRRSFLGLPPTPTNLEKTTLRCAALAGNIPLMELLLGPNIKLDPKEISNDYYDTSLLNLSPLHLAAWMGQIEVIQLLMGAPHHMRLRQKTVDGDTALHYLVRKSNKNTFNYLLENYPEQVAECWTVPDEQYGTIHTINNFEYTLSRSLEVNNKPIFWLREHFARITKSLLSSGESSEEIAEEAARETPSDKDIKLLTIFADEWRIFLSKQDQRVNARALQHLYAAERENSSESENQAAPAINQKLRGIIFSFEKTLELYEIETSDQALTTSLLEQLIDKTKKVIEQERGYKGKLTTSPGFHYFHRGLDPLATLETCLKKWQQQDSTQQNPDENILRVIDFVINDSTKKDPAQFGTHYKAEHLFFVLATKISSTDTMLERRPSPAEITEEITEENFPEHLEKMEASFSNTQVDDSVKQEITNSFIPGVKKLINHKTEIVSHLMECFVQYKQEIIQSELALAEYGAELGEVTYQAVLEGKGDEQQREKVNGLIKKANSSFTGLYTLAPGDRFLLQPPPENNQDAMEIGCFYFYASNSNDIENSDILYRHKNSENEITSGALKDLPGTGSSITIIKQKLKQNQASQDPLKELLPFTEAKTIVSTELAEAGLVFQADALPIHGHRLHSKKTDAETRLLRQTLARQIANKQEYQTTQDELLAHLDENENKIQIEQSIISLLYSIFHAFYQCRKARKLDGFFQRLSDGICIEIRTRDAFEWATRISNLKHFHDFMQQATNEYTAYKRVIKNITDEPIGNDLDRAAEFIATLYQNDNCQIEQTYAPMGIIDIGAIKLYLENILGYTQEAKNKKCTIM